ncbi:MAG: VCBS repeat-containing protein [Pyrinomonadaceae bacterium]
MRVYSFFLSIVTVLCLTAGVYAQGEWYVAPSEGNSFGKFSRWIKGFGKSSDILMMGDVDGDGRADAIAMNNANGDWQVAESKGKSFSNGRTRIANYAVNSTSQMMGDVNGDGRDDAVSFYLQKGEWYVALARGGGRFDKQTLWLSGHGIGNSRQFLADVDNDDRADAVICFPEQGLWYVALSTGSSFSTNNIRYENYWIKGHGIGSSAQLVGDVTGDGRADSLVFFNQNGQWYTAPSTGRSFSAFRRWTDGHGIRSTNQFLGDVDGDGKDDAVVFFTQYGSWYASLSNGSSFGNFSNWIEGHGINSTHQFLADVTGDGKDDAIVVFAN